MIQIFKVILLLFSFSSIAGSGVGGSLGGGGVKPELERIINFRSGGVGGSAGGGGAKPQLERIIRGEETPIVNEYIRFNLDEIEEVTLKDGSVVKTYEILELMKK